MKANEAQVQRAVDAGGAGVKLLLFHGPDDAGSQAMAVRFERAMGPDAERIDLDGSTLAGDPARLPDEASALSLFGTRRHIRVTGGDDCAAAVEALLELGTTTDPVVMVAGHLKPSSAVLKAALADSKALAFASYRAEGARAVELAVSLGRTYGLRVPSQVAEVISLGCGGNRAVIERELEKFACYLDAAPDRPREVTMEVVEAIGAELSTPDQSKLVDGAFDGRPAVAMAEFAVLADGGGSPIPALRAIGRRAMVLARLRGEADGGKSMSAVMASSGKSLFPRDRSAAERQLPRWRAADLARAATRAFAAEQALKQSQSAGDVIAGMEIVTIARAAERRR